jgi:hypothetical protein
MQIRALAAFSAGAFFKYRLLLSEYQTTPVRAGVGLFSYAGVSSLQ